MKFILAVLALLVLAPAARALCLLEVPDPIGDASPSGLPPYYDLGSVRLEWNNSVLDWSWNATGMEDSDNVFYFGGLVVAPINQETGQPDEDTGAPHFHPECDRSLDVLTTSIKTTCLLSSSPNDEGSGGAVIFTFVSDLEWTQEGDWLTVHIPAATIGLEPGFGITDAYASVAISLRQPDPADGRATPYYPDRTDLWTWNACWTPAEDGESPPPAAPVSKEAPAVSLAPVALILIGFAVRVRRS